LLGYFRYIEVGWTDWLLFLLLLGYPTCKCMVLRPLR
jgi:hypothetical protein